MSKTQLRRSLPLLSVIFALCIQASASDGSGQLECLVGREGGLTVVLPSAGLSVKSFSAGDDIRVWIAGQKPAGSGVEYDLRFVPQESGEFNLGDYLITADKKAVAGKASALVVHAVSTLQEANGKLSLAGPAEGIRSNRYRLIGGVLLVLWLLGLVQLMRSRRKQVPDAPAAETAPTLTDEERINSFADRALDGNLTTEELLDLERLLLARLNHPEGVNQTESPHPASESVSDQDQHMRQLLERWLYSSSGIGRSQIEMILNRCRQCP